MNKIVIYFIVLCIIIIISAHYYNFRRINTELRILQTSNPTAIISYELFREKLPIVFQDEMNNWECREILECDSLSDLEILFD